MIQLVQPSSQLSTPLPSVYTVEVASVYACKFVCSRCAIIRQEYVRRYGISYQERHP